MLNKLLAGNGQNPNYIEDLNNFIRSASKERLIRGVGFVFIILALLLQQLFDYVGRTSPDISHHRS